MSNVDNESVVNSFPYPVYIAGDPERDVPKNPPDTYFIIGAGGIYMGKRRGLVDAVVQVTGGISFLGEVSTNARMNLPKIPAEVIAPVLAFFKWASNKYHSEAMVLLYYNAELEDFLLVCPDQEVSVAGIAYIPEPSMGDYICVGDIHSHNSFGAYHSATDKGDEKYFDGLHITIGNVLENFPTVVSSIVISNNRFQLPPEDFIEGLVEQGPSWEVNPSKFASSAKKIKRRSTGLYQTKVYRNEALCYDLLSPEGESLWRSEGEFPEEWQDYVKETPPINLGYLQGYSCDPYGWRDTLGVEDYDYGCD